MSTKKIDAKKLKKKLDPFRTSYIIEQANNKFTRQAIFGWKTGRWDPTDENIEILLEIIGCSLDDILETPEIQTV